MAQVATTSAQQTTNYYTEQTVASRDGTSLFVRRWLPAGPVRAHVLLAHGYMDHGGRFAEVARYLTQRGFAATALDFRGHGKSQGQRGYVASFQQYLDDLHAGLDLLDEPKFILGHSNGALITLDYLASNTPNLAGVCLTNPFLAQTHPVAGLKGAIGRFAATYLPRLSLPSGMKTEELTDDLDLQRAHKRDPLVFGNANAGWFREATAAQARVRTYRQFNAPLLYIYSDSDPVASPAMNRQISEQLTCKDKTVLVRHGELHEVLNAPKRIETYKNVGDWMEQHLPA